MLGLVHFMEQIVISSGPFPQLPPTDKPKPINDGIALGRSAPNTQLTSWHGHGVALPDAARICGV